MDVDRARVAEGRVAPDAGQQHLAGEHAAGVAGQRAEDLELDVGRLDVLAAHAHGPLGEVDAQLAHLERLVRRELGADDYNTKPFSLREFRSRVKAALRRSAWSARAQELSGESESLEVADLKIDFAKRTVRLRGEEIPATYVEFEILRALACNPGRVFTRDMLLTRIWGDSAFRDPRTIDVHIRHLREKLEIDAKEPDYIFTVRGVGYRFRDTDT